MKWYLHAIRNYANFDDRASRTEYWMFGLFNSMFAIFFFCIDLSFKINFKGHLFGPSYIIYALFSFLPSIALAVRRLHDVGKSGSHLFLALIPLVGLYILALFCTKSEDDENDYGEKPINSDIADFIQDDKTSTLILVSYLLWIFISKIIWTLIVSSSEKFYDNPIYKYFNIFSNFVWMFLPIILSLSIRNYRWKIILLICSVFYMIYAFYEFVKAFILTSDSFQF
jgi:uncharacterized membrane protein YhaH (DUF805 family)